MTWSRRRSARVGVAALPLLLPLMLPLVLVLAGCTAALKQVPSAPLGATPMASTANPEARRLYLLGRIHLYSGRTAQAAAALAAARRFDPTTPWIPIAQGDVALAQQDLEAAREWWSQAVDLDASCGPAWLRIARVERALGDLEASALAYESAAAADGSWHARSELVDVLSLIQHGQASDPLRAVVKAWVQADLSSDRDELRQRAEARVSVGDLEGAWADFDAYLEQQPDDPYVLSRYLTLAGPLQHLGQALDRLNAASRALPSSLPLAVKRARFMGQIGHSAERLVALDHLVALPVSGPTGHRSSHGWELQRAEALLDLSRPAQALAALDAIRAVEPQTNRLDQLTAQAYLDLGQPQRALAVLNNPVAGDIGPVGLAVVPWVALLRRAGATDQAWAMLQPLVATDPSRPSAVQPALVQAAARLAAAVGKDAVGLDLAGRLGVDAQAEWIRILVGEGRRDDAMALLEQRLTVRDQPGDLRALGALLTSADPARAVDLLAAAVALDPAAPRGRVLLAAALLELGRLSAAQEQVRILLSQRPKSAAALNLLAWSLVESGGDLVKAEELAWRARDVSPADPHIIDTLGWIRARAGDPQQALGLLEEALSLAPDSDEIQAHIDAVHAGVLPPPLWSSEP